MVNTILQVLVGALSGATVGCLAACVFSLDELLRAYTGWRTFWPDCGPHLFIPFWLGAVIGLVARVERDSSSGFLTTLLCGIAAGFAAPWLFFLAFGKTLHISFGFVAIAYAEQIVLAVGGGVAALFWYFSVNKILR
jgi:uncharacterized membrane protein YeaQ/YmgE (transglycosylase-associated protein family)